MLGRDFPREVFKMNRLKYGKICIGCNLGTSKIYLDRGCFCSLLEVV